MNKSVITSVSPRECELIASGRQTMLVRKTRPKIETPFKCYIYCTKGTFDITDCHDLSKDSVKKVAEGRGKVIGSFVCDRIDEFDSEWSERAYACAPTDIQCTMPMSEENAIKICKEKGCMTLEDIIDYFGDEEWRAYFWHISDLKIYDKPKELGEFGNYKTEWVQWYHSDDKVFYPLTRPPKSYIYCEPIEEE